MNVHAMKDLLTAAPFQPFEVVLSSGDRYAVRHPENVQLLKDRVLITYFTQDAADDDALPDRFTSVSYLHIAAAEPMKPSSRKRARR